VHGFQRFLGPKTEEEHVYKDGSKEFKAVRKQLQFSHDCFTPHTPQTNGIAERAVRKGRDKLRPRPIRPFSRVEVRSTKLLLLFIHGDRDDARRFHAISDPFYAGL